MEISSSTYRHTCEWGYYMDDIGYFITLHKLGTSFCTCYEYYVIFGVWVLGSAEIINTNPATMSKRQFVIPVPAIAWLDLMQLTS